MVYFHCDVMCLRFHAPAECALRCREQRSWWATMRSYHRAWSTCCWPVAPRRTCTTTPSFMTTTENCWCDDVINRQYSPNSCQAASGLKITQHELTSCYHLHWACANVYVRTAQCRYTFSGEATGWFTASEWHRLSVLRQRRTWRPANRGTKALVVHFLIICFMSLFVINLAR